MARPPRAVSSTGCYHITLRGNGKQVIFEDDDDRIAFLELTARHLSASRIAMLAWCLMDNHAHLCVRVDDEDDPDALSQAMQLLETGYAKRFNVRSGHVGHVFHGRFGSTAIESDAQLLETVRYIHNNPQKAGICPADEYRWSSYREYTGVPRICDTSPVLDALGGVDNFAAFMLEPPTSPPLPQKRRGISDEEVAEIARAVLPEHEGRDIKALPRDQRDAALACLRAAGLSVKQIERLTGIGKNTITRATVQSRKMGQLVTDTN